jgi:excisionase family DNA binding protein
MEDTHQHNKLLLTTDEAASRLGLSRSVMQKLMYTGEIASLKIGSLRRVPARALTEYVERQMERDVA